MSKRDWKENEIIDLETKKVYLKDGTRLTDKIAAQLAEDAISKTHTGRPSLSGTREHSPQVAFRVPPTLRRRAERVAKNEGITVSALAREALEEYVASH